MQRKEKDLAQQNKFLEKQLVDTKDNIYFLRIKLEVAQEYYSPVDLKWTGNTFTIKLDKNAFLDMLDIDNYNTMKPILKNKSESTENAKDLSAKTLTVKGVEKGTVINKSPIKRQRTDASLSLSFITLLLFLNIL